MKYFCKANLQAFALSHIWIALISLQQTYAIKPSARWANECVLLLYKGTLDCFGGQLENNQQTNALYSLDLSQSWNTTDPAWSSIDSSEITSPVSFFASTYLKDTHQFFIDGGLVPNNTAKKSTTSYYNTVVNKWTTPTLKGLPISQRKQHTAVSNDQGQIWLWGGISDSSTYSATTAYYNQFTVIDSTTWTVSTPLIENNPPPRIDHTATMISNKYILIVGGVVYSHEVTDSAGQFTLNPVSMSNLVLYNIESKKWINITAGGNIPAPRRGHSAVLSNDSKSVIVFGGGTPNDDSVQLNDVFILELETMRWSAPSINGVPPKPRKYHRAHLVGELMLVTFGLGANNNGFDDVNILSTSTWSWITQYNFNKSRLTGNEPVSEDNGDSSDANNGTKSNGDVPDQDISSDTRIKAGVIAGVVSGGVVILGGGIFLMLSFALFKRKKVKAAKKSSSGNSVDPANMDSDSFVSDQVLEAAYMGQFQKPDNRSSHAAQLEDGQYYKPNAFNND